MPAPWARREFLAGMAAMTAATTLSRFASAVTTVRPFCVSVINDEISQDFGHVCEVASRDFGMGWIELRSMWKKNIVSLDEKEVAEARRILDKFQLKVTDIASPLFKVDWPGAPKSKYSEEKSFNASFDLSQQDEVLERAIAMMTTAAGTITPARVFVIGAGVAGLQAISTARRLGAVASAYDMRPAAKEQVQSLGGRFVELPIEAQNAQDARGYGVAQDETFYARQRQLLTKVVAESDIVITAAVIPGKKSPVLITADMVKGMAPGSVIVDLASERGGNCELTRTGEVVKTQGVTIIGTINLASTVPYHVSGPSGSRQRTSILTFGRVMPQLPKGSGLHRVSLM